jgi:hypothetical protein
MANRSGVTGLREDFRLHHFQRRAKQEKSCSGIVGRMLRVTVVEIGMIGYGSAGRQPASGRRARAPI